MDQQLQKVILQLKLVKKSEDALKVRNREFKELTKVRFTFIFILLFDILIIANLIYNVKGVFDITWTLLLSSICIWYLYVMIPIIYLKKSIFSIYNSYYHALIYREQNNTK